MAINPHAAVDKVRYAMAERHLQILDESASSFTFQTFSDRKRKLDPLAEIRHGSLADTWGWLDSQNQAGAGVFVCVNETDLKGRQSENVTRVRALWQEADRGDEPALPIEPHLIIESSPGKHHRYVLVADAPMGEFEPVQQRLVDDYGSDPNAKDRARVLRLAGFFHRKNSNKQHLVRIVHESGSPPIGWEKAKQLFPPVPKRKTQARDPETTNGLLVRIAEIKSALEAISPDIGYMDWLSVGMALHSESLSSEALELWDRWSQHGSSYRPGECAYRWGTFSARRGGVTILSLFYLARKGGWCGIDAKSDAIHLVEIQRERMFSEFSARHGVAMINGRSVIVYREQDKNSDGWETRFTTPYDMATHMKNVRVPYLVKAKDGTKVEYKHLFPIWLEDQGRKTYSQVVFRPVPSLVAGTLELPDSRILNLYQGLAVSPKEGDCEAIKRHIWEVWSSERTPIFYYLLDWLACIFQRPNDRGHTVVVLRSGEGTGKNIIIDMLVRALGSHAFVAVKPDDLTGKFNDHLATSVLVFCNEALWGGDKKQEGTLKSLVTDSELPAERKFHPKFRVRNCTHIIMATNNDWPVPVGLDDRRFFILDLDERYKGKPDYFRALAKAIDNGGDAAFIYFLMHRDISGFDPRLMPDQGSKQDTRFDAKIRTADTITQWWAGCLYLGEITAHVEEVKEGLYGASVKNILQNIAEGWEDHSIEIAQSDLYASYKEWVHGTRRQRAEHQVSVGRKIRQLAKITVYRPSVGGEGVRPRVYRVPPLPECRSLFEKTLRQEIKWDQ